MMRLHLGMTLAQTAAGAETTAAQVMKLENGERRLTLEWVERLSRAFGCLPLDLIAPAVRVPIERRVDDLWNVVRTQMAAEAEEYVSMPRGFPRENMIVLRPVKTGSLAFLGEITMFCHAIDTPLENCIGDTCLVRHADGTESIRRIFRMREFDGDIRLQGPGEQTESADTVEWCARVAIIACGNDLYKTLFGQTVLSNL